MYLLQVVSRPPPLGIESDLFRCVQLAKEVQFYFKIESNWAPSHHGISCWDRLPFNYNRYPKTYGHISFAALEGPNRKIMISSSPLYSEQDEHRYILWIPHLTTCWKPIKEWTLFDTQTERFIVVKGILRHFLIVATFLFVYSTSIHCT